MTALSHLGACPAGVYESALRVSEGQVDVTEAVTPGAIARYVGDATVAHLASAGVDGETLHHHGLLMVLARTHMQIYRLPRLGEPLLLRTWAGAERHWLYPRRTVLYSGTGARLVGACSQWLLIDTATRRLAPPSSLMGAVPVVTLPDEPKAPALQMPFPTPLTGQTTRVVQHREIDRNGHLNNACYLDWATALPQGARREGQTLSTLWIEYSKELFAGQEAHLCYLRTEESLFLKGAVDGEASFSLRMDYITNGR